MRWYQSFGLGLMVIVSVTACGKATSGSKALSTPAVGISISVDSIMSMIDAQIKAGHSNLQPADLATAQSDLEATIEQVNDVSIGDQSFVGLGAYLRQNGQLAMAKEQVGQLIASRKVVPLTTITSALLYASLKTAQDFYAAQRDGTLGDRDQLGLLNAGGCLQAVAGVAEGVAIMAAGAAGGRHNAGAANYSESTGASITANSGDDLTSKCVNTRAQHLTCGPGLQHVWAKKSVPEGGNDYEKCVNPFVNPSRAGAQPGTPNAQGTVTPVPSNGTSTADGPTPFAG